MSAGITAIDEVRSIRTEKAADGSIVRTETIITKAANEEILRAHLATAPTVQTGRGFWDVVLGRPF